LLATTRTRRLAVGGGHAFQGLKWNNFLYIDLLRAM
jgi:hypothetical protein